MPVEVKSSVLPLPVFVGLSAMRLFWITTVIVLSALITSCRKEDIRTVIIYVPEMRNKACIEVVSNALSKLYGVQKDKIQFDLSNRTVIVIYDSLKLALKNMEFAIAEAGFRANEVPANPEAVRTLPPECK